MFMENNGDSYSLKYNSVSRYIKSLNKKVLTKEEEREFLTRINMATGEEKEKLQQEFIEHNLRLVISIAVSYAKKTGDMDSLLDLIQQGNIGLIEAMNRFGLEKETKFSSYACIWIKKEIIDYLCINKAIGIPKYMISKMKLYSDTVDKLNRSLNIEVTDSDISKTLNWTDEDTAFVGCLVKSSITSLNEQVNDENDNEVCDFVTDECSLEDKCFENNMVSDVHELLNSDILTENERKILLYRYGFCADGEMSREKIARKLNMSAAGREIVRKTEIKALQKLKTIAKKKEYDAYLH